MLYLKTSLSLWLSCLDVLTKSCRVFEFRLHLIGLHAFIFPPQIWFYTNDIFENAGVPAPEIQYTTAGTGIIEIIAGLIGVSL